MRFLALIGALAIVGAIVASIYFFGGYYSVSAVEPQLGIVDWTLVHIRTASIEKHAVDAPPSSLDDPAVVRAGASAFAARGCVNCHGAPGAKWAKFSEGLRPDPPDLGEVAKYLTPAQVFWVIKNGINMTGMPSFERIKIGDEETWSIVAFVKKLPNVTPEQYSTWTAPTSNGTPPAQKQ